MVCTHAPKLLWQRVFLIKKTFSIYFATEPNDTTKKSNSIWKRAVALFCGLGESASTEPVSMEEDISASVAFIQEEPASAFLVNASCLVMLCVMVFLFAYYA